jgi:hypothetical protein
MEYDIEDLQIGSVVNVEDGQHEDWDGNFVDVEDGRVIRIGIWGREIQE